jgi:hypothetical protein
LAKKDNREKRSSLIVQSFSDEEKSFMTFATEQYPTAEVQAGVNVMKLVS